MYEERGTTLSHVCASPIRLLQDAIVCFEQDASEKHHLHSVERPLDLARGGISHPQLCIEAIPHPNQWDDGWLDRIRILTPKDLAILHRQQLKRCAEVLAQVRPCLRGGLAWWACME